MSEVLTGERVYLRAVEVGDAEAYHEMFNESQTHLIANDDPFVPQSLARIRAGIEKDTNEQLDRTGNIFMTAVARADDSVVGLAGLWGFAPFLGLAHVGLGLRAGARGQGYGRELVTLVCQYGFRMRQLRRIELETVATNVAMRRVAEQVGFLHEGTHRQRAYDGESYVDVILYGLLRSEWRSEWRSEEHSE